MNNWERLVWNQRDALLAGLQVTVEICLISFACAVVGGLALCLLRMYVKPARPLATVADPDWTIARAADLDGDGKGDLVWVRGSDAQAWVWLMDGARVRSQYHLTTAGDPAWKVVATP